MNDSQLLNTPSYLDAKRKLVKEKLARRIQHDREDQNYANKNRAALAGATGVIVLLAVFAFGILEIDVGLPMINKGFQHAVEGTHTTGNDLTNAAKMPAADMDPSSQRTSPNPSSLTNIEDDSGSEEVASEEAEAAATEEPEEKDAEEKTATEEDVAEPSDEGSEEATPTPAPAVVEEAPFVVIEEEGKTAAQPSETYLQEPVPEEKGMFSPTPAQATAEEDASSTTTTDKQEEKPKKGLLGTISSALGVSPKATETPKAPKKNVNTYPECNNTVITKSESELDFMSQKVMGGQVFTEPFASAMYVCNFWPEALYARMNYYFPPEPVFEKLKSREKQKKCGKGGCHQIFKMDTLKKADNATMENWPKFVKAKKLWEKVEGIVFNKRFEQAVFDQLKVDGKLVKKRQIHFLSDKHGYTDGTVQTNRGELGEKVATMHFFIINNTAAAKDYGVCTHTEKQYKERQATKTSPRKAMKIDGQEVGVGEAACDKMFRFTPNSGVAIKTGPKAYHSVPNYFTKHHLHVDRNVIVVDWYK
eukprot:509587-Prorocentrum_minimum.AAC.1